MFDAEVGLDIYPFMNVGPSHKFSDIIVQKLTISLALELYGMQFRFKIWLSEF